MTTHTFPADVLERAKNIRVAIFDVDGVFTDGGLLFTEQGETIKRFSTLDGHGLKALQKAGITPAVITGRDSAALRKRLTDLGIQHARRDWHVGRDSRSWGNARSSPRRDPLIWGISCPSLVVHTEGEEAGGLHGGGSVGSHVFDLHFPCEI